MIIIRLDGGLGNQMFQYALGFVLSKSKNTSLKFDDSMLGEKNFHEHHTNRNLELGVFDKSFEIASPKEIEELKKEDYSKLSYFFYRYFYRENIPYFKKNIFYEKGFFVFDSNIFKINRNCYLLGYWQNEKYFSSFRNELLNLFQFPSLTNKKNIDIIEMIKCSNSVSVHIRRGDYVNDAVASKLHGNIANENYYKDSIELIKSRVDNTLLFVFSDEVEWVKENIEFPENSYFINWNKGDESYIDMQLMSNCKHNIIANSSFSWWSAWLNKYPKKIVIAPKKWMNGEGIDDGDICPSEWERL
ncbi:MAG: alpha-1,2-fucosyltransferase [Bacteroidota bacterium]